MSQIKEWFQRINEVKKSLKRETGQNHKSSS